MANRIDLELRQPFVQCRVADPEKRVHPSETLQTSALTFHEQLRNCRPDLLDDGAGLKNDMPIAADGNGK